MSFDVPDACTLPTVEQPLRLAEFDALFASAVREVETITPTHARMRLAGPAGLEATVRDLTARETSCCSFFSFTTTPQPADDGEALTLEVEVPPQYADVLASLAQSASTASAHHVGCGPAMRRNHDAQDPTTSVGRGLVVSGTGRQGQDGHPSSPQPGRPDRA